MKIELEQKDIQAIAREVVEMLEPLLNRSGNDESEDTILDVQSLAKYLEVQESWIYRQVCEKNIPYFKVGKYTRFRKAAVDTWIEKQGVKPIHSLKLIRRNEK